MLLLGNYVKAGGLGAQLPGILYSTTLVYTNNKQIYDDDDDDDI